MKFFSEMTTLYWWLSVFLFGVLFTLLNNYIQRYLDNTLRRRREKLIARKDKEIADILSRIERINDNPIEFERIKFEILDLNTSKLYYLITCGISMLASSTIKLPSIGNEVFKFINISFALATVLVMIVMLMLVFQVTIKIARLKNILYQTKYFD